VRTELTGFSAAEVEARVALDRETQVRIMMVMEEFADEILVTAEAPVVDTTNVTSGDSFNEDFLQNAATSIGSRDYLSIIGQAAGTSGGSGKRQRDGRRADRQRLPGRRLNTTDPITATFAPTSTTTPSRRSRSRPPASRPSSPVVGGVVNLVTKSGGNEFSGALDARYRDETFYESGEHYDADEHVGSLREISATLGGPIVRDRLWFFASIVTPCPSARRPGRS